MRGSDSDWFILRTAGRSTLPLAASLAEDGFEVWTPARTQLIRVPRMNVRREIRLPLLPSFVFARARHLCDLLELANMPDKPRRAPRSSERHSQPAHRDFSVFHHIDKIPMIDDRHLEPLRTKERQVVLKKDAPGFERGAQVRVNRGAFEGLKGKVERCKQGYALVIFTDWKRPVKIPTFLLSEIEAINAARRLMKAA
jgi:transcription antitermination factor NusG